LPAGLHRAIEFATFEITTADEGQDLATGRSDGDQGRLHRGVPGRGTGLPAQAVVELRQSGLHRALRNRLQTRVQRRPHHHSAAIEFSATVGLLQCASHLFVEVGGLACRPLSRRHDDRFRGQTIHLCLFQVTLGDHPAQHQVPSPRGLFHVAQWRVARRSRQQADQRRGLTRGQRTRGLAEVVSRRRLQAVESVAEVDVITVGGQYLLFGELPFDLERQEDFLQLASHGALATVEEQVTRELHGQRAGALGQTTVAQVVPQRTQRPDQIDADVLVEARVLTGDQRLAKRHGYIAVVEQDPLLRRVVSEGRAVPGKDPRHLGRSVLFESTKTGHVRTHEVSGGGSECRREKHRRAEHDPAGPSAERQDARRGCRSGRSHRDRGAPADPGGGSDEDDAHRSPPDPRSVQRSSPWRGSGRPGTARVLPG